MCKEPTETEKLKVIGKKRNSKPEETERAKVIGKKRNSNSSPEKNRQKITFLTIVVAESDKRNISSGLFHDQLCGMHFSELPKLNDMQRGAFTRTDTL